MGETGRFPRDVMRLAALAALIAGTVITLPSVASAADPSSTLPPVLVQPAPPALSPPAAAKPLLTEARAVRRFLAAGKVRDWVGRYPKASLVTEGDFHSATADWTIGVWSGAAGEIASGRVDDRTGEVTQAWTGPQVAWAMARGQQGAFGGKEINSWPVWLAFSAAFLLGLADLRRPLSLRNLDLLALLSFSVSLWFFNHGLIFSSVPLVYPGLLYLLARSVVIGVRGGPGRASLPVWPVWLLAAATVFLAGFRISLNLSDSNVIDVGYAGVVGAQRLASAETPWGHFPVDTAKPCAAAGADGSYSWFVQANGRCESAIPTGDTYGPFAYEAYLPGYAAFGWKGKGDDLDAARFTSILFDVLAIVGLALVGRRFGGRRLAVTLAFAWAAYPFSQYVSSSNTNDAIQPVLLIFGFWLATSPPARGAFNALAGWTKFGALLIAPLWATYPDARRWRSTVLFCAGFLAATIAAFSVLLLDPNPLHAARVFYDRTFPTQIGRESPFSLWDWRQYHAGLPDLHVLQYVLEGLLVAAALVVSFLPRRKTALQLAAFTGALLLGFELVLTHWFYAYLVWFFPFFVFAVLAPSAERAPATAVEPCGRPVRELVTAG
jgi:hypothetical protein